jgi:signal transduction histidine kinase
MAPTGARHERASEAASGGGGARVGAGRPRLRVDQHLLQPMNWIELLWHLMAGSCLALSGVTLIVWLRRRDEFEHLSLALAAAAVAAMAVMESIAIQVGAVGTYAVLARWFHVPAALLLIALVPLVRLRYGVGNLWLGVGSIALRLAALAANFASEVNLNLSSVHELVPMTMLGTAVFAPVGSFNPWMVVGSASMLMLVGFLVDAAWKTWRQEPPESRLRASAILASAVVFVSFTGVWSTLVATGAVTYPFLVVPPVVGIVLSMGYDLGAQLLRVPELSRNLAASEAGRQAGEVQLHLAGRAGGLGTWSWHYRDGAASVSDGALSLLDVPPGSGLDATRLAAAVSAHDRALLWRDYAIALAEGREFQGEFRLALEKGGVRWLSVVGHVERDGRGEPLLLHGVLIDISARKLAEQEAGQRRDELAHLSRVALLAELSGSLAHELNQPLTAILSNAQAGARFLSFDPPDLEEVRASLASIVDNDKRAGEVIRRLRAMLRKEPPDFQRLDVNDVIADVLGIVRSDLIARDVDTVLQLQADLPATTGDRIQLQQVLLNLIMNGCDGMDGCAAPHVLTIRSRSIGDDTVRIEVGDVGRGIPEQDLERIFEPFVSSKGAGLGLGLAVCRTIVQAHGGRLWAANNPGSGATLYLELRSGAGAGRP